MQIVSQYLLCLYSGVLYPLVGDTREYSSEILIVEDTQRKAILSYYKKIRDFMKSKIEIHEPHSYKKNEGGQRRQSIL